MSDVAVLERPVAERPTRPCPDCGVESAGEFCPECGEAMEFRLPHVGHYLQGILGELLAFDTKFMHTIPALLFRPGLLAQEFVAGRRKRYLSPLRLHILIGIALFLAMGFFANKRAKMQVQDEKEKVVLEQMMSEVNKERRNAGEEPYARNLSEFNSTRETLMRLVTEVGPYVLLLTATPLFAVCLWFLYRKQKRLYVEHLIFALYFFSFSYLLLIPPFLLVSKYLVEAGSAIFCVYLYFGLRKFYRDRGYKLIVRTVSCIVACSFITGFAFVLSLVVTWVFGGLMGELPWGLNGTFHFG
jgi:hypothetical protein